MYAELINKFLEASPSVIGLIIADREKETPIEYSIKQSMDLKEIEELSRAVCRALKTYEENKSKSNLITMIFNTDKFAITADDYQDNNRVLIFLSNPIKIAIKEGGEYLKQIIEKIKSEK
ncbi:MAG: hypothetical protein ACK4GR_04250, partial [bacterium]